MERLLCLRGGNRAGRNLSEFSQSVEQFRARARLMRDETRRVAPVNTATREQQVVAPASGNATGFHLALARLRFGVVLCRRERQPDIFLYQFTNGAG